MSPVLHLTNSLQGSLGKGVTIWVFSDGDVEVALIAVGTKPELDFHLRTLHIMTQPFLLVLVPQSLLKLRGEWLYILGISAMTTL